MLTIERDKHENNFTVVNNDFINDKNLSASAKGVMLYLLSLPDDWVLYESELVTHFKDGIYSIQQSIKELIENNYLEKKRIRINGKYRASDYILHEVFYNRKSTVENLQQKNQNGFSTVENQQILNTNKLNTNKPNTNKLNTNVCVCKAHNTHTFTIPTIEEIKNYCNEKNINIDCEKFFYFYESKGWMVGKNKMKSWHAALRTWQNLESKDKKSPDATGEQKKKRDEKQKEYEELIKANGLQAYIRRA